MATVCARARAYVHDVVGQVWDRWRDRPFWASQQAMKNLRDEADVMLYLVNAAESPEAAGAYVQSLKAARRYARDVY